MKGERNAEGAAAGTAALQHERAPVCLGDPSGDREAKAGALSATRRIQLHEPIEDPLFICRRHSGTGIGDADPHRDAVILDVDGDRSPGRGVLYGVLNDVQHQLAE